MPAQPEHLVIHVERLLTRVRQLRDEVTGTPTATVTAWGKWIKRCGVGVAIPVLTSAAWVLSRSKLQVASAAGAAAILGAVTASLVLLPVREPLNSDSAPPIPDMPSRTIQSPTKVTTPPAPPTTTSEPATPPSPPEPPTEPPAAEPTEPSEQSPPQVSTQSAAAAPGATDSAQPLAAPPPESDSEHDDNGEGDGDGGDGEDRAGRRTQCLQVRPLPETDINACIAKVAELVNEVIPAR